MSDSNSDTGRPSEGAVLHYIDKLYSTQTKVWESMNRIMFVEIALSLIIIALSTGVFSVEEDLEVSGLKIKLTLLVFLNVGALLVTSLFASFCSQLIHANSLRNKIVRLYKKLGYEEPDRGEIINDAFQPPSIFISIIASVLVTKDSSPFLVKFYQWVTSIITVLSIMILIPVGAQVAAALKVVSTLGWRWWVIALYAFLFLFNILSMLSIFLEETSEETSEE